MEIAQYHRKASLLASAGNVIARPSGSWGELEQLGNVLTQIGLASEQERLQAEYHDQINSAKLQVARQFEEYQNSLDPDNTDKWDENLDKSFKSYDEIELTNAKARADWSTILEAEKFRQKKSVSDYRRTVDARNFQRNYYLNKEHRLEMAADQERPQDYDWELTDSLESLFGLKLKEGAEEITSENLETIEGYDNPMFQTEELRINEARAWLKDTKIEHDEKLLEKFMDRELKVALISPDGLEYLNKLDPKDYDFVDEDDIVDLKKNYRTQKNYTDRLAKEQLEARQYNNEVDLYLRMPQNDPEQKSPVTLPELNDLLKKGEITKTAHDSLRKQMLGEPDDIITDQRVMTELEKDAYNVSNGSVNIADLRENARKARYDEPKKIDDDDYHSVIALAYRKHETYQANAMGEAITYARYQLLAEEEALLQIATEAVSGDESIAKKIVSLSRLQNENYSQYKRALDEWFESEKEAGREPDDDDIYIKSRKMLVHYRQRVLDESIYEDLLTKEEIEAKEMGRFFKARPPEAGKFKGKKSFTQKDYDDLESGAEFFDPETGKWYRKP